ncbi:proteasome assembly chaperone 3-like [Sceloporus undulatus]|uniref:proteasome assembly chaperone 3-like n=1 Tax=Sceloporus undulatus TaxID=8520 RepID=UPI001C4D5564|nr:proteasome assembly chaperone 3-like [Sceloporus undulatus]
MAAKSILALKQAEEVIRGILMQVVYTDFGNMILVVVTQYGKMGTFVSVEPNMVVDNVSSPLLTTKVLLGKDEPLVHICAKHLMTSVSQEARNKPVLLAMVLKDKSMEGVWMLQEMIRQC